MLTKMQEGKLKVFSTCRKWFQEKAVYHRKDGKIIALDDDLISASRYALLSLDRYGIAGDAGDTFYSQQDWEPMHWKGVV